MMKNDAWAEHWHSRLFVCMHTFQHPPLTHTHTTHTHTHTHHTHTHTHTHTHRHQSGPLVPDVFLNGWKLEKLPQREGWGQAGPAPETIHASRGFPATPPHARQYFWFYSTQDVVRETGRKCELTGLSLGCALFLIRVCKIINLKNTNFTFDWWPCTKDVQYMSKALWLGWFGNVNAQKWNMLHLYHIQLFFFPFIQFNSSTFFHMTIICRFSGPSRPNILQNKRQTGATPFWTESGQNEVWFGEFEIVW